MAILKFIVGLGSEGIYSHYDATRLVLQAGATSKLATYVDSLTGDKIRIEGKNLTFQANDPVAGTITKFTYLDENNNRYMVETDAKIDALQWKAKGEGGDNFPGMFQYSLRDNDVVTGTALEDYIHSYDGNDIINAGKGADEIFGGRGNDRLTGGSGPDAFFFHRESGRDVITDFDATGGGALQDRLYMIRDDPFDITKSGQNVVITFEEGGRITLLDVKFRHFDEADYSV